MPTNIEYALMAGYAYYSTRDEINRFPPPSGWAAIPQDPENSGFEASAFGNAETLVGSTEIVISYAGTDFDDKTGDVAADAALGTGLGSEQLYQAVEYYLQIKAINPGAKITLTGHSLGGGLASLVAIFFNETAMTFDQGPFRNSANTIVANNLLWSMASKFPAAEYPQITTWLAPLDRFIRSFDPFGLGWSADGLDAREAKVTNLSVQGEFLSTLNILRIGTELDPLTHGDYFGPIDLHSQALLTTFVQNDGFRQVTFKLTDLLPMIFDENLYEKSLKSEDPNLLEHLLRHEVGGVDGVAADGDKMLSRFTADLQKLAATSGLSISGSDLTKALIAFAMQAYYEGRIATDVSKQLYESIGGGLHFERSEISADPDLDKIKGHVQYFKNYLATLPPTEQALIEQQLPNLLDWYLAGTRLAATATDKTAFMLGAGQADSLTGGSAADLLVGMAGGDRLIGNGGADTLVGGSGTDFHFGGAGQDRYVFDTGDGEDLIIDGNGDGHGGDGQGRIEIDGQELTGSFALKPGSRTQWQKDGWTATFAGPSGERGMLVLTKEGRTDKIIVPHYQNGELGITLEAPPEIAYTDRVGTDDADNTALVNREHNASLETTAAHQNAFGMGGADLIELKHADTLGYGGANNDVLRDSAGSQELHGEDGNDLLIASAGDDRLFGGIGDDVLQGGADNDFLDGGDGMDFIDGGQGSDYILGGSGDDFILGGGNLTLELSAVGAQYNDFADGQIAMLTKNAGGQFVLPDLAGISPTDARAYEAEGWVNVEGVTKVSPGGTAGNDGEWRIVA